MLPWILALLVTVTIFGLGLAVSAKKERLAKEKARAEMAERSIISVVTQKIIPMNMVNRIELPAVVEAWDDLLIKSEVVGKVVAVYVKEGQRVDKGASIVQVDPRDYKNRLAEIEAQQRLAEINFDRLQKLIDQGAVAQAEYDKAAATLNELSASRLNAQLDLERCTIKAPFAGIINDLPAILGMLLAHGDPVAQLLDIERLKVEVAIPEAEVAAVRNISESKIIFAALDNLTVMGKKIFLARKPLTSSMVYTLRLAVDNPEGKILPGMFARVDIIKKEWPHGIGVPLFSVLTQGDKHYVYVVQDDIAHKRMVTTGFLEGWKIQITSGLKENEQVVIVGHRNLEEGQKVKVLSTVTDPGEISI